MSSQSFDLESAFHGTLFTAALFNELKFISVLVRMCPLFYSTSGNFDKMWGFFSAVNCLMLKSLT